MDRDKELERYRRIIQELQDVPSNLGVYPKAVHGMNKEESYEERDGFKNGWNACVSDYGKRITSILYSPDVDEGKDLLLLLYADAGWMIDGILYLNMNDTFAWACADAEEVPMDQIKEVARLYRWYGTDGLNYWVSKKRNWEVSEFGDVQKGIKRVRKSEEKYHRTQQNEKKTT